MTTVVERFLAIPDKTGFETGLEMTWNGYLNIGHVIMADAIAFDERQKEERTRVRHAIVRNHQRAYGFRSIVRTSPCYPQFYDRKGTMEWRWRRRKHAKGQRGLVFAATLPVDPPIYMLLKHAHEDEVEVIRAHAAEIQRLRAEWKFYQDLGRVLKGRMLVLLNERERRGAE